MPLKNVDFKTNVFTGTRKQQSTGEGLAKLLLHGVDTANKGMQIHKQLTEQELREQEEQDQITYMTQANEYKRRLHEGTKDGSLATSESIYALNTEFLDKTDELFPSKDSKYRQKYQGFVLDKESIGHNKLKQENKAALDDLMDNGIAYMPLADLSMEEVNGITQSGKLFEPTINNGFTFRKIINNTTAIAMNEFADVDGYIKSGGTPYTKEDLVEKFGGELFKEIKDHKTQEWQRFDKTMDKIASDIKTAYTEKEASDYVKGGGDAFTGDVLFDTKLMEKTFKKEINNDLLNGNWEGAINKSNQLRMKGKDVKLIDNKIGNQFKTRKGDANAYQMFNSIRDEYAFDQSVIDNYVMLEVIANQNGYDLTNNDHISNALAEMAIVDNRPIPKETTNEFQEELHSRSWYKLGFGDKKRSPSKINFVEERGRAFIRYGMDADEAIDLAEDMYEKNNKLGNDIPLGMLRLSNETEQEDLELLVKSFSANNAIDDTDLRYIGNNKWKVTDTNTDDSFLFSTSELKNRIGYQRKLQKTRKTVTDAMRIGDVSNVDDKKVAKIVRKKALEVFAKQHPDMSKEELNDQADRTFREALDKLEEAEKMRKKQERVNYFGLNSL